MSTDREGVRRAMIGERLLQAHKLDVSTPEEWLAVLEELGLPLGATEAPRTVDIVFDGPPGVLRVPALAAPAAPGATPREGPTREWLEKHADDGNVGAGLAVDASADGVGTKSDQPAPAARQPEADPTPAPAPDPLWAFLETCLGLHSAVELLYVVDGYEVTMTERDGQVSRAHGHGETLRDAVAVARQAFGPEVPE